jgi:hypothetical protein
MWLAPIQNRMSVVRFARSFRDRLFEKSPGRLVSGFRQCRQLGRTGSLLSQR